MALKSSSKPDRLDIPGEPGEWVELRRPSVGDLDDINELPGFAYTIALLQRMISAWSYKVPVNEENLRDLEAPTYRWLESSAPAYMNRAPEEKKDLPSPSLPITDTAADTLPSSAT